MRKFLSAFLSLVLCLSLMPSAFAAGTTEVITGLGYNDDITCTISNVLDKCTVMLNFSEYDYEAEDYVTTAKTFTLYQIPYTGAHLTLSVASGSNSTAFPGGDGIYRLTAEGAYTGNEAGEAFLGQIGSADADSPWEFDINFSELKLLESDIFGLLLTFDDPSVYFTCADLGKVIAAAGVEVEEDSDPDNPFIDVFFDAYYYNAVIWAYKNGVTTGTSTTTFGPDATCDRGQVVTFLWRAMGSPEPTSTKNPFTDVKESDYFYKPVLWAVEKGITNGTSATTFGPKQTCTSGHVITFLWRANGSPAVENKSESVAAGKFYTDAVAWGESLDLFEMIYPAFNPENSAPRAEIVTYLYLNRKN